MKRFQLPLRKGTELLPNTSQQPTKLIIRGVPADSLLYSEIAATFAGRLKQFHGRQQQAYSLSSLPTHKARADLGGAIAIYSNINGQEVLELEVDVIVLEQLVEEEKKLNQPWDWLLVELVSPWAVHAYVETFTTSSSAVGSDTRYYGVAPNWQAVQNTPSINTDPWKTDRDLSYFPEVDYYGFADAERMSGEDPPVLQWAGATRFDTGDPVSPEFPYVGGSILVDEYTGSLLVDLRSFKAQQLIKLDLHADIPPFIGLIPDVPSTIYTVRASAFRGDPGWSIMLHDLQDAPSESGAGPSFFTWETKAKYPARFALGVVAANIPISQDLFLESGGTPENPVDPVRRGTLSFDQATGSFSYKPA